MRLFRYLEGTYDYTEWAPINEAWEAGKAPDGTVVLRDFCGDEMGQYMVPVEPCEHGKYDGHWPGVACRCYKNKRGQFGTLQNRASWGEYIADVWITCIHMPWCDGAESGAK